MKAMHPDIRGDEGSPSPHLPARGTSALLYESWKMFLELGYIPNLRHPRTFNEKVAHRKLFGYDPRFAQLANKWTAREYVRAKVGEECLSRVYQFVTDPEAIDVDALPDRFVIKGVHDWGSTVIVDDKRQVDWPALRARLAKILGTIHGVASREYWYTEIPPGLIIEERLTDARHDIPMDLKLFVFHGRVHYIQVLDSRYVGSAQRFYDAQWTPLKARYRRSKLAPVLPRPDQFQRMIEVAETLAEGFDFVRVDLYLPNERDVIFGEFTFAPHAGRRGFTPRRFDRELGDLW